MYELCVIRRELDSALCKWRLLSARCAWAVWNAVGDELLFELVLCLAVVHGCT